MSVNDETSETLFENRHIVIREMVEDLKTSYGSTEHILVNILGMKRVKAMLVQKE